MAVGSDSASGTGSPGQAEATGPLRGVRVLDLTRYLAGPFCTMLLADYGANVVRVEAREGREFRLAEDERDSYFFLSANRGKRSLALDARCDEGRALLRRLVGQFDVVVENFRPGVMARLGLDPAELIAAQPRLVVCSISGFGADGPYAERPGFDQIAQGMSGFMSLTGTPDSGPTRAGIAIADLLAGLFGSNGIALALLERERTGRGQRVDTSLLEAMIGVLSWGAGMYFESDRAPGPAGQHHPLSSPYGRFLARDGYLNIAAGNEAMWRALVSCLLAERASEWLDDPRFAQAAARVRHRDALTAAIEQELARDDVVGWVETLNAAGVPCGPVLDLEQVFADPQVLARAMRVELPHPERGRFVTTGLPVKLSATPGAIERRPPLHGEHDSEVLAECGLSQDEIAALRANGVIGSLV